MGSTCYHEKYHEHHYLDHRLLARLLLFYCLSLCLFVFPSQCMPASSLGLYSSADPLLILTESTFSTNIYYKEKTVHVVQFYNSYCGHCIQFAPTWKKLAKSIKAWRPLIELAVVDCADDQNTKLCRENGVNVYPTIRLIWLNAKPGDVGEKIDDERSVSGLEKSILKLIMDKWKQGVPNVWPDLMQFSALTRDQFFRQLPMTANTRDDKKMKPILMIIENQDSFIGREIILDLSSYQNSVLILRMLDSYKSLLNQLLPTPLDTYVLPILLSVNQDYSIRVLATANPDDKQVRQRFTNLILNKYVPENLRRMNVNQRILGEEKKKTNDIENQIDVQVNGLREDGPVYMVDLNNALHYSLFNEIPLKKTLNSTQLMALRNYLQVIINYFPFQSSQTEEFVKLLFEWLNKHDRRNHVDVQDLLSTMKLLQESYHFPKLRQYKSCLGSSPKYRGYPCSMWLMFHTLSVQEYLTTYSTSKWSNLHAVLYAMRAYITNFFGCTDCAAHFGQISADLENQLKFGNSSLLWLWKAHNQVNMRTKGSESEDPAHPKVQYPTKQTCPHCYQVVPHSQLTMPAVLQFLVNRYKKESLIESSQSDEDEVFIPTHQIGAQDSALIDQVNQVNGNRNVKWSYSYGPFSGADYSLILFLYAASLALILSLCVFLKIKRRKVQRIFSMKSLNYSA